MGNDATQYATFLAFTVLKDQIEDITENLKQLLLRDIKLPEGELKLQQQVVVKAPLHLVCTDVSSRTFEIEELSRLLSLVESIETSFVTISSVSRDG